MAGFAENNRQQQDDSRRRRERVQQQFRLRLLLFLRRAAELRIHARRKFYLRRDLFLRVGNERRHVASFWIAGDGLPPPRAIVQNRVTPGREKNIGQLFQRHLSAL